MSINLFFRRLVRLMRSGSVHSPGYRSYVTALREHPYTGAGAVFNLTIDFELAWGRARRGEGCTTTAQLIQRSHAARQALPVLLELAENYRIPITFAMVAHVALQNCAEHAVPPSFKPRWAGDWFVIDPKTNINENKDYYGYDLVQKILKSSVRHEIASHSFSHVDLGDDATTSDVANFEITQSHTILERLGREVTTFVFPKNHPGFIHLLKQVGFTAYRGNSQQSLDKDEHGLWRFPLGLWLSPLATSPSEIVSVLKLSVQKKALVNMWCHLYEFPSPESVRRYFEPIFKGARHLADNDGLAIRTMQDIIKTINHV